MRPTCTLPFPQSNAQTRCTSKQSLTRISTPDAVLDLYFKPSVYISPIVHKLSQERSLTTKSLSTQNTPPQPTDPHRWFNILPNRHSPQLWSHNRLHGTDRLHTGGAIFSFFAVGSVFEPKCWVFARASPHCYFTGGECVYLFICLFIYLFVCLLFVWNNTWLGHSGVLLSPLYLHSPWAFMPFCALMV